MGGKEKCFSSPPSIWRSLPTRSAHVPLLGGHLRSGGQRVVCAGKSSIETLKSPPHDHLLCMHIDACHADNHPQTLLPPSAAATACAGAGDAASLTCKGSADALCGGGRRRGGRVLRGGAVPGAPARQRDASGRRSRAQGEVVAALRIATCQYKLLLPPGCLFLLVLPGSCLIRDQPGPMPCALCRPPAGRERGGAPVADLRGAGFG